MTDLKGALATIIADPDCCAASKAIARAALLEETQRISNAEAALDEIAQIAQSAGDYSADVTNPLIRGGEPEDLAQVERAKVVAWLRAEAMESKALFRKHPESDMAPLYASRSVYYEQASSFIERGHHLKDGGE